MDPPRIGLSFGKKILLPLLVALLVVILVVVTQFGSVTNLSQPLTLQGDEIFGLRIFANLGRFNSFSGNDLGWPTGQNLWDYPPVGDLWNLGLAWIFVKIFGDIFLAYNLFFLATFALQSFTAYYCVNKLTHSKFPPLISALIFPLLPYHFDQGSSHLMLSNYFVVMVGLSGLVRVVLVQDEEEGRGSEKLKYILLGVLCSGFGIYYALFFVITSLVLILYGIRRRQVLRNISLFLVGQTVAIVAQFIFIIQKQSGELNTPGRQLWASDLYSLKPFLLILPSPWGRSSQFSSIYQKVNDAIAFKGEGTSALGIGLSLVFFTTMILVVGAWRSAKCAEGAHDDSEASRQTFYESQRVALILTISYVLMAVSGGGNALLSVVGLSDFRVWSRVGIFIATTMIICGAFQLDRWISVFRERPSLVRATGITFLIVLLFELVPVSTDSDVRLSVSLRHAEVKGAVQQLEETQESGAFLQLPIIAFPEEPPVYGMSDYSHFLPSLYSERFSWSYGSVKYSNDHALCAEGTNIVKCAQINGFSGIWIDRFGYPDNGNALFDQIALEADNLRVDLEQINYGTRYSLFIFNLHQLSPEETSS